MTMSERRRRRRAGDHFPARGHGNHGKGVCLKAEFDEDRGSE